MRSGLDVLQQGVGRLLLAAELSRSTALKQHDAACSLPNAPALGSSAKPISTLCAVCSAAGLVRSARSGTSSGGSLLQAKGAALQRMGPATERRPQLDQRPPTPLPFSCWICSAPPATWPPAMSVRKLRLLEVLFQETSLRRRQRPELAAQDLSVFFKQDPPVLNRQEQGDLFALP